MSKIEFNVISVRLNKIEFFMNNEEFTGDINLETEVDSKYSLAENDDKMAKMQMTINVFPTAADAPFRVQMVMEGIFGWREDIDKNTLENLFAIKGNDVLYSYARPIITQMTTFAGFSPLFLPLINFDENDNIKGNR